jgi:hypothetical protein
VSGEPDFGPCCCCHNARRRARNVIMLPRRAPEPGKGWGCVQCGLEADGAVYVACDECLESERAPTEVCSGWVTSLARVPIRDLSPEPFEHDMSRHPGER